MSPLKINGNLYCFFLFLSMTVAADVPGFIEKSNPVYCTSDWMCKTYCPPDREAYCPSVKKMGPEVKYGTCYCCDSYIGFFEQSNYGCSQTCSQVNARIIVETRPQPCVDKNAQNSGYFSSLWGIGPGAATVTRQDNVMKKEAIPIEDLKIHKPQFSSNI